MNLYLLCYLPDKSWVNAHPISGLVVAALRSSQARAIAEALVFAACQKHGDFENEALTACKLIGQAAPGVKAGVILSDTN